MNPMLLKRCTIILYRLVSWVFLLFLGPLSGNIYFIKSTHFYLELVPGITAILCVCACMFCFYFIFLTINLSDHYHGEYLVGYNSAQNFLSDQLKNTFFFFFFCLHFAVAVVSHLSIAPSAAMPSLSYVTAASVIPCYKSIMQIAKYILHVIRTFNTYTILYA